ncbi:hypothetical protein [Pediococcus acidilactici]|uniref:hypothetical protein n=1 Tax=Pediococcus acidilactici TaxID=1254 RepID=UPI0013249D80|nr:hypothetical protein [Pediococcus acidilactici]KAF0516154.1 hypothetical protein GBP27_01820 [Pediococcus acidilactici]
MAKTSLRTVANDLVDDVIANTNIVYKENQNVISMVPVGQVERYDQFVGLVAECFRKEFEKILIIDWNFGKTSREDNLDAPGYQWESIGYVKATEVADNPKEFTKILINSEKNSITRYTDFDVVLVKYRDNIFEQAPYLLEKQKRAVVAIHTKGMAKKIIRNIDEESKKNELEFLAPVLFD